MLYVLFMIVSTQGAQPLAIPVRNHPTEDACIAERNALRADLLQRRHVEGPRVASDVDLVCQVKERILK